MVKKKIQAKLTTTFLPIFLKFILPIILIVVAFFGFLFILLAVFGGDPTENKGGIKGFDDALLSDDVLQYRGLVTRVAKENKIEEHVDIILALMMQESGGQGNDPMQASESKCGKVGCITDPDESIKYGVKHFSEVLDSANGDIKLTLQSYNFGSGFIDYAMENGGKYTQELAIDFSAMMYKKVKDKGNYSCVRPEALEFDACYGDIYYVDAVMQYYTPAEKNGDYVLPVSQVTINSEYGWRTLGGQPDFHAGLDFDCVGGATPIFAIDNGEVEISQWSDSFGNYVSIKHGKGVQTRYGHLSQLSVKKGQKIKAGQTIGVCGTTGNSTGPHLHLDVIIDGKKEDPKKYLGL